ncbi:MAG: M15 family metallopeptidase [Ruminococcus sp.]|nr:M15 family metallopeptidase [Ruminococcus sp.]
MPIFTANPLSSELIAHISGITYQENPHISLEELCALCINYNDFEGRTCIGEMICAAEVADDLLFVFKGLFEAGYRIEKIQLADVYGGDDDLIMADNCTSCFNYRCVAGTDTLSMHALGRAVDINPLYNPYIVGDKIMPPAGAAYADRTRDFPHKIDESDLCYRLFKRRGWKWGGHWTAEKDYQHFYKPLRAL